MAAAPGVSASKTGLSIMQKDARKAAIAAYKERKPKAAVIALRCAATGAVWVGPTLNPDPVQNKIWFTLKLRSHPNRGAAGGLRCARRRRLRHRHARIVRAGRRPLSARRISSRIVPRIGAASFRRSRSSRRAYPLAAATNRQRLHADARRRRARVRHEEVGHQLRASDRRGTCRNRVTPPLVAAPCRRCRSCR